MNKNIEFVAKWVGLYVIGRFGIKLIEKRLNDKAQEDLRKKFGQ